MIRHKPAVLFFLTSAVRGGVEEVAASLARGLAQRGWRTHLAAPGALLRALEPDLDGSGARTLDLTLWSWRQIRDIRCLIRYLREHGVRIVNSHLFYATAFAAPLARLAGVPVIIETVHGPEAWRRSWWKRSCWLDQCLGRLVTAHIAVSEAVRQDLIRRKRYPPGKIHVVPNGRDCARFASVSESQVVALRERLKIRPEQRVLLCVGRLEPQKDPSCLLAAFPYIVARFPDVHLVFAGDGALRPELEELARRSGLAAHVTFAGFIREVPALYRLAELVVLPSLYEGMPLVAIEAGAAGRPIVATAVDGTPEVVEQGRTGLLVPPRDPEALSRAVCELLADPARALTMGDLAQRRIRDRFTLDNQVRLTEQVFESCLWKLTAA